MICLLPKSDGTYEPIEADVCAPGLAVLAEPPVEAQAFSFNDVVEGAIIGQVFYARRIVHPSRWRTARLHGGDPQSPAFAKTVREMERAGLIVATNRHGALAVCYEPESAHLAQKILAQVPWSTRDAMAYVA